MQETKPWYQSATIIGSIVSAIVGILAIFHVNIADLAPDLTTGLLGFGLLIGVVTTIIGRCRANASITLGKIDKAASLMMLCILGVAITCLITACGSDDGASTASSSGTSGATDTDPVAAYLPLIQSGASVATGAVLQFAVSDSEKRAQLANQIYASAKALDALSTGAIPSVSQVQATLNAYNTGVDVTAYGSYVSAITSLYSTYFSKLKGDGKYAVEVLNALAKGAYSGASIYATISVTERESHFEDIFVASNLDLALAL